MDDLEFRKRVMADPNSESTDIKEAILADRGKKRFLEEMRQFDDSLQSALKVPVPDNLAERIILNQSLQDHKEQKSSQKWYYAMAAGVFFTFGVMFQMLYSTPEVGDLGEYSLSHYYHETSYLSFDDSDKMDLSSVNEQLADFGIHLGNLFQAVTFVEECRFNGVRSLHMVFSAESGEQYTVFITSHEDAQLPFVEEFSDNKVHGKGYLIGNSDLVILSENAEALDSFKSDFEKNIIWQI